MPCQVVPGRCAKLHQLKGREVFVPHQMSSIHEYYAGFLVGITLAGGAKTAWRPRRPATAQPPNGASPLSREIGHPPPVKLMWTDISFSHFLGTLHETNSAIGWVKGSICRKASNQIGSLAGRQVAFLPLATPGAGHRRRHHARGVGLP